MATSSAIPLPCPPSPSVWYVFETLTRVSIAMLTISPARLDHRLYFVHRRQLARQLSQLYVVGPCLHVLLHCRHHNHCWRSGRRHLPCRGTSILERESLVSNNPQIASYLAAGLVFTSSAVNNTIYEGDPAKEAAAAGYILLSMIAVCAVARIGKDKLTRVDHLDLLLRIPAVRVAPYIC